MVAVRKHLPRAPFSKVTSDKCQGKNHRSPPKLYTPHSTLVPFLEPKPQQTGTRLLIGYGEVATTSGSTNFHLSKSAAP
jgi:hypothetical protein